MPKKLQYFPPVTELQTYVGNVNCVFVGGVLISCYWHPSHTILALNPALNVSVEFHSSYLGTALKFISYDSKTQIFKLYF